MAKNKPDDGVRISAEIDSHPRLGSKQRDTQRLSGSGVARRREPTSPEIARYHPNMVWDYSKQRDVFPNGNPTALIEATHTTRKESNYDPINRETGRPFALGVQVGGSPDSGGWTGQAKPPRHRQIKG